MMTETLSDTTAPRALTMDDVQLKAALDADFRAELLADPAGTLKNIGVPLHDDLTVKIIDQAPGEFILPIPPAVEQTDEIDDDAAAGVAAGSPPLLLLTATGEAVAAGFSGAALAGMGAGGLTLGGAAGWALGHFL